MSKKLSHYLVYGYYLRFLPYPISKVEMFCSLNQLDLIPGGIEYHHNYYIIGKQIDYNRLGDTFSPTILDDSLLSFDRTSIDQMKESIESFFQMSVPHAHLYLINHLS